MRRRTIRAMNIVCLLVIAAATLLGCGQSRATTAPSTLEDSTRATPAVDPEAAPRTRAQDEPADPPRAASRGDAEETASSCLSRFAAGEPLPAVPAPQTPQGAEATGGLLDSLMGGVEHHDEEASEQRARLAHCLPRELGTSSRLTRSSAAWLAQCYADVAARHRSTDPEVAPSADMHRAGCGAVSAAMATRNPDIASMLASGTPQFAPGVAFVTIREPRAQTEGERRMTAAFEAAGAELGQCRQSHGTGEVRVAARRASHGWEVVGWSVEGSAALVECTLSAMRSAPTVEGGPPVVVFDLHYGVVRDPRDPSTRVDGLGGIGQAGGLR